MGLGRGGNEERESLQATRRFVDRRWRVDEAEMEVTLKTWLTQPWRRHMASSIMSSNVVMLKSEASATVTMEKVKKSCVETYPRRGEKREAGSPLSPKRREREPRASARTQEWNRAPARENF